MHSRLQQLVKNNLTDELRKKQYRGSCNKFTGHCYVASEAFYHLTNKVLTAMVMRLDSGGTHWFLKDSKNNIIDLTVKQFDSLPNYKNSKPIGFLTKKPSKRAQILIERVKNCLKET